MSLFKVNLNLTLNLLFVAGGLGLAIYGFVLYRSPRILVEWQTATEIDTVGFNLYRSEQPGGPYQKLNETIIPSSGEPLKGHSYRYVDATVVPNRVYYYQLEDVDTQGKTTRHDPISVQAKPQGISEMVSGGLIAILGFALGLWNRSRRSGNSRVIGVNHG